MPPLPKKQGGLGNGTGDASGLSVLATGATTARTNAARAADVVNVREFGARGDGVTDDAAAINAAFAYVRSSARLIGGQRTAKIVFPQGNYVAGSSLNWTGFTTRALTIEGGGAIITSKATGKAAIDMMGSRFLRVRDLYILGDQTNMPKTGIQMGRTGDTDVNSADNHSFENVYLDGYYSLASIYNLNSETTKFDHVFAWNKVGGGAYSLIQDGLNHFGITSDFVTLGQSVNASQSFNENLFLNCDFRNSGGGTPIWSAQTARHRYISSYVANTAGSYGMELYSYSSGDANAHLDVDVHFETTTLTDVFLLSGPNASPKLIGFRYRDQHPYATNSVFKLASGVTSAALVGADIEVGTTATSKLFDAPAAWTVTGRVLLAQSGMWNAISGSIGGLIDLNGVVSVYGQLPNLSLPTTLIAGQISNPGGVSAIAPPSGTYQYNNGPLPLITIGPPQSSSGSQAIAVVSTMSLFGYGTLSSGGSGYVVNDILSFTGGTPVGGIQRTVRVTAVDANGAVTGFTAAPAGAVNYTSLPPNAPMSLSGGAGAGAAISGQVWRIAAITVTATGSGYTSAPSVTYTTPAGAITGTAVTLSGSMVLNAGLGNVLLDGVGTKLGSSGTAGSPVLALGALIDSSGVRQALTGSAYTVPANSSLVRFTQTSTIATQTVNLPTAIADGQSIQFVQQGAGAVTALTFSPVVQGWTNGSQLNAGPGVGLRIRWDATAAAWYREQ